MFGTAQILLIRGVSLYQGCPYRGVPLYTCKCDDICLFIASNTIFSRLKISMNVRCTMEDVNITVTIPLDLITAAAILAMD